MQSVAIVLGLHACDPWEMAGKQFGVISECIIYICIRCSNFCATNCHYLSQIGKLTHLKFSRFIFSIWQCGEFSYSI